MELLMNTMKRFFAALAAISFATSLHLGAVANSNKNQQNNVSHETSFFWNIVATVKNAFTSWFSPTTSVQMHSSQLPKANTTKKKELIKKNVSNKIEKPKHKMKEIITKKILKNKNIKIKNLSRVSSTTSSSSSSASSSSNVNQKHRVIHYLPSVQQGDGVSCGFFATLAALIMTDEGLNFQQVKQELAKNDFKQRVQMLKEGSEEIENIDVKHITEIINNNFPKLKDRITVLDVNHFNKFIKNESSLLLKNQAVPEILVNALSLHSTYKQACAVIYNTGRHWITFGIRKQDGQTHIFRTDSLGGTQGGCYTPKNDSLSAYLYDLFDAQP